MRDEFLQAGIGRPGGERPIRNHIPADRLYGSQDPVVVTRDGGHRSLILLNEVSLLLGRGRRQLGLTLESTLQVQPVLCADGLLLDIEFPDQTFPAHEREEFLVQVFPAGEGTNRGWGSIGIGCRGQTCLVVTGEAQEALCRFDGVAGVDTCGGVAQPYGAEAWAVFGRSGKDFGGQVLRGFKDFGFIFSGDEVGNLRPEFGVEALEVGGGGIFLVEVVVHGDELGCHRDGDSANAALWFLNAHTSVYYHYA